MQLLSELRTAELIGLVVGLILLLAGCAPIGPSLEILEGTEWVELGPVIVQSVTGRREGADVNATGVFTQARNRMTLSLEFVLGPPPRFVRGTHISRIGGKSFESAVSSESVTFLGGQNTAPSIGGVFLFENPNEGSRYRLRFPPTLLDRPR